MGTKRANGEGSIYPLPNGRWRVLFSYQKADGSTGRISRKVKTRAAARVVLDELRGESAAGATFENAQGTVGEFLDEWLKVAIVPNRAENTIVSYRGVIENHLKPQIGSVPKRKLTAKRIETAIAKMQELGTGARTRQHAFVVLKAALNKAEVWGEILYNPCRRVEKPQDEREEIRPFTREETQLFLTTVAGHRHEALYRLALTTGMRQGELFGLRRCSVNLTDRTIYIYEQATEVNGKISVKRLKTRASVRTINLTSETVASLVKHFAELDRLKMGDCDIVFPNEIAGYQRRHSFNRWSWQPMLKKAGLEHRGFHHTRHTCATLMLVDGIEAQVVARILGHASAATLLKMYAHVLPGREGHARDQIGKILG